MQASVESSMLHRMFEVDDEDFDAKSPIPGLSSIKKLPFRDAVQGVDFGDKAQCMEYAEHFFESGDKFAAWEGGPSIDSDAAQAIYAYTCQSDPPERSLYAEMNSRLRDRDRTKIVPFRPLLVLMLAGLTSMHRPITRNLWRGVNKDLFSRFAGMVGKTIVWWGFTSATTDMQVLTSFIAKGGTIFCIRAHVGAFIKRFSAFSHEEEVLLPAACRLRVLNLFRTGDHGIVEVEVVGNLLGVPVGPMSLEGPMGGMSMHEATSKDPSPPSGRSSAAASSSTFESPAVVSKETEMEDRFREALKLVGKDDDGARRLMQQAAEGGHGDAQNYLGNFHAQSRLCLHYDPENPGKGVSPSHEEAVKLFRLSAEQGNASGQCNLGVMYGRGHGVKQDYVEAVRLYWLSAEQGNAWGQCNLGNSYYNGHGVKQDYVEAVGWYRLSAEQGAVWGQCNLATMYYNGRGVSKDLSAAREWYKKAAAQGHPESLSQLQRIAAPPPTAVAPATTPVLAAAQAKTPAVVSVTVEEARNLFFDERKKCDPFVSLRLEAPHYKLQAGRTQIQHTRTPSWSELFNFTIAVDAVQSSILRCSVLNADGRPIGSEPVFGNVQPLSVESIIHETSAKPMDAWFDLEPVQGGTFPPGPKPQVRLIIQGSEPGKFNEKLFVPAGEDSLSKDTHATPAASPGHSPTIITGISLAPSSVSVPKTDKLIHYVTLERISRDGKELGTIGISFSKADIREPFTIDKIEIGGSAYHDQTLRVGDVIIQVDNQPVRNLSAQQMAELIRGDAGTKVQITYERK